MSVIPPQNTNKQQGLPNLTDLLRATKKDTELGFNAVNIGIIKSFDAGNQTATIQLALKTVISVAPDGTRTLQERPLILECPCFFPFGGGSYLSMPIQAGDNCIVLFNDREIDNWFQNGGMQTPSTYRTHDSSDAFALVGIKNLQTAIGDYIVNGCRLAYNATSRMTLTNNQIETIAELFLHNGDMRITGDLTIEGVTKGNSGSGNWELEANLVQESGKSIHAGNGANGTFNVVTVVDGIVISGS